MTFGRNPVLPVQLMTSNKQYYGLEQYSQELVTHTGHIYEICAQYLEERREESEMYYQRQRTKIKQAEGNRVYWKQVPKKHDGRKM